MYRTIAELLQLANQRGAAIWEIILENEMRLTESSADDVFAKLDDRYAVMCRAARQAFDRDLPRKGGLIDGIAHRQLMHANGNREENDDGGSNNGNGGNGGESGNGGNGGSICGGFINRLMARALSCSEVNAAMGKICAAPTAGACGILPAVLISVGEKYGLERRRILEGLLTAAGIGAIITQNATVSGAEGGCQAECGVAAAMAAAAAVHMAGGSNDASVNALCFALMNVMGLVCDPVAGLVQVPCAQRNASQAVNAVLSADLALGGMVSIIPADEIIEAMYQVGRMLPMQLRETALGGLAGTPTGKQIMKERTEGR